MNDRMRANRNYILREIAGEAMLIPVGEAAMAVNGMITLNPAARCIWQQLEAGKDEAAILAALLQEFDVDADTAASDLRETLTLMREKGMLEE